MKAIATEPMSHIRLRLTAEKKGSLLSRGHRLTANEPFVSTTQRLSFATRHRKVVISASSGNKAFALVPTQAHHQMISRMFSPAMSPPNT